jgi:hypothetical protein
MEQQLVINGYLQVIADKHGMSHFGGDDELAYDFVGIIKGKRKSRTTIWMGLRSVYV